MSVRSEAKRILKKKMKEALKKASVYFPYLCKKPKDIKSMM